jgi:hypothetical protein
MEEKHPPLGLKISAAPLGLEKSLLSLPLYLIEQIPRLIQEAKKIKSSLLLKTE